MTPAEVDSATFRFVAQHLNHCVTAVMYLYGLWMFLQTVNEILFVPQLYSILTGWHIMAMTNKFSTGKINVELLHFPRKNNTD